jgi:two-component system response regulator HydG
MDGRILVVDDDRDTCDTLAEALVSHGLSATTATSAADALVRLAAEDFDVVMTDVKMHGTDGLELCKQIATNRPDLPVVVVTGFGSMETAIGAIRAGAYDFVTKPIGLDQILLTLERAIGHRKLRDEVKRLRTAVRDAQQFGDLIGTSAPMQRVYDLVERVARTEATVLISGESGTGKELVAKAMHRGSSRSDGPFIAVNCAAMPESLLESELFGHVKGAFTDARQTRQGLFLAANGGTLFLDEIGEMPLGMQAKLLRVLQERTVRPVGGDKETPFDTRIVTATNRDLETAVAERTFREDLFYRINVVRVEVPPLRARAGDVLLIAQHFVERFAGVHRATVKGISGPAAERLVSYPWPGNVRELQNSIERAVALTRYEMLAVEDLPEKVRDHRSAPILVETDDPRQLLPMDEVERRYILRALGTLGGNKTLAAQVLGLDRRTLYRKLERYAETEKSAIAS